MRRTAALRSPCGLAVLCSMSPDAGAALSVGSVSCLLADISCDVPERRCQLPFLLIKLG